MATATKKKTTSPTDVEKDPNRCDRSKIQIGDVFSRHSHGVVTGFVRDKGQRMIVVQNSAGREWGISDNVAEWECSFANQFDSDQTVSTTEAIEILRDNPNTAMTITFHKKVKPEDVAKALEAGKGSQSAKAWKDKVKAMLEGEERTMIGHHTGKFDPFQRLFFTEEVNERTRKPETRLVDLRTLKLVIVNRTRYTVK